MSRRPVTAETGPVPRAVGIWIELDLDSLATARDDPRIRHARGLVLGLDAVYEVEEIVVPCLPAARGPVGALFADAGDPGRPLSPKLRVVAAGRDRLWWSSIAAWAERRLTRCRERLAMSGCTAAPRSWPAAVAQVATESPGRPLKVLKRLVRVVRLAVAHAVLAGILKVTRALPTAHDWLAGDLRRRAMAMPWLVPPWAGSSGTRLPGTRILDLGGHGPADGGGLADWAAAFRKHAATAAATVVPSRHAAACLERVLAGRPDPGRVAVIPSANRPGIEADFGADIDAGLDEAASRARLADDLRTHFSGGDGRPLHRHYCDFPFERVDYLLATPPTTADGPLLTAYATVLRRHRRDLKLVIVGRLPLGPGWPGELESLGLVFDVIEAAGLPEAVRLRLVRHARGVVVTAEEAGGLPEIFPNAVASGTPVVLGRLPATREALAAAGLPEEALAGREYFEPGSATAMEQAILHVLDHRAEVLDRQRGIVAALEPRTWPTVAADYLAVMADGASRPDSGSTSRLATRADQPV